MFVRDFKTVPPPESAAGSTSRSWPQSRPGRLGSRTLSALLGLSSVACGPAPVVPRVGDSLLDLITQEHIEAYPASNLPSKMTELQQATFLMRSMDFDPFEWVVAVDVPDHLLPHLESAPGARFWRLKTHIPHLQDPEVPRVLLGDEPLASWVPEESPFPGVAAWYEASSHSLYALSVRKPRGMALEYFTNAQLEFSRFEKLVGLADDSAQTADGRAPRVAALLGREELQDKVSRPCLLLPAGGAIVIPFERFPAQGMSIAVGIAEGGFEIDSEAASPRVKRAPQQSDGATFVLEVVEGQETHEVWTQELSPEHVGTGFLEYRVDLSQFTGRSVSLRLMTKSGAGGDASFDYGLWSDLRLLGVPAQRDDRPHIILIDIDTLRADRLSCYGYSRPTTPRIDAWFEKNGVRFEDARAPAPWTLPSTASMLTGLAPHQHRVLDQDTGLSAEVDTLAEILGRSGYETLNTSEGAFFRRGFGLDAGFDKTGNHVSRDEAAISRTWLSQLETIRTSETDRPVFLFMQTYLVHSPFEPDERFLDSANYHDGPLRGQRISHANVIDPYLSGDLELSQADKDHINGLYDAGVARMDELVGAFLDELDSLLDTREALVILTSDHGEEFWEHGQIGHGHTLYDELLRVPMLVRFPSDTKSPPIGVSHKPVSLLDIVPTALDVAGLGQPAELSGLSLREELPDRRPRIGMIGEHFRSFEYDSQKLILGSRQAPRRHLGPIEFYLLDEDPGEHSNQADALPTRIQRLSRGLDDFINAHPVVAPREGARSSYGAEEARRLRELGYIGGE